MALSLDELVVKYIAGTMTDAELKESGYEIHQVEDKAGMLEKSTYKDNMGTKGNKGNKEIVKGLELKK